MVPEKDNLMSIFDINLIKTHVKIDKKDDVLRSMVDDLFANTILQTKQSFLNAILERETVLSTGIGHGIAVPHSRHKEVAELKAIVYTLAKPIEYEAIDDNPVNIIIMLAVPPGNNHDYMVMLHNITSSLKDEQHRKYCLKCHNPEDLLKFLQELESGG